MKRTIDVVAISTELAKGADPLKRDSHYNWSSIYMASLRRSPEVVHLLIQHVLKLNLAVLQPIHSANDVSLRGKIKPL